MVGYVYAVASGKGGVGKTTTAINLGVALRRHDRSVAIVDGDLGMPNLATMVGVEFDQTIHDYLAGTASLDDVIVNVADDFTVLPGDPDLAGFAAADPDQFDGIVDTLADRHEFVIVDTGAGLSYESVLPLEVADEIIIVTAADPSSIADARRTVSVAGRLGTPIKGVVVTHASPSIDPEFVGEEIGATVLAVIPNDQAVVECGAAGRPLEAGAPDAPATAAYRELAAVLLGEDVVAEEPSTAGDEPMSPQPAAEPSDSGSESAEEELVESTEPEDEAAEPTTPSIGGEDDGEAEIPGDDLEPVMDQPEDEEPAIGSTDFELDSLESESAAAESQTTGESDEDMRMDEVGIGDDDADSVADDAEEVRAESAGNVDDSEDITDSFDESPAFGSIEEDDDLAPDLDEEPLLDLDADTAEEDEVELDESEDSTAAEAASLESDEAAEEDPDEGLGEDVEDEDASSDADEEAAAEDQPEAAAEDEPGEDEADTEEEPVSEDGPPASEDASTERVSFFRKITRLFR